MDDLIKFVLGFALVVAIIYAIFLAIALAAFVAMLLAGVISFNIVKSGAKGLVKAGPAPRAMMLSLAWASVVTTGCILGSFALVWALALSAGDDFGHHMSQRYGEVYDFRGFTLGFYNWILVGAYAFFFKAAAIIYLANRIFIARNSGGHAWLGVVPPLLAMLIFFCTEHWDLVVNALTNRPHAGRLWEELWVVIMAPVELALQAIRNPDALIQSGIQKFKESDGSIFRLGKDFPKIF